MSHSSLILSALAHIGLLILAAVGLPALHDPPDPFEMAVPVTVTMVSERTEAKAPLPPPEPLPPEAPPEPEPVAAEPPPVETPPIETPPADPPKPEEPVEVAALAPEPPKPEPLPPEPEPAAAPLPPSPPEPEPEPPASDPKPAPLPQRPPQQQARAKAPPKPPEPAPDPPPLPQIAPKDPPDELAALRKAASGNDLDKLRSALANKTPVPAEEAEEAVFTVSEKHRLFRQLSQCWQEIPGLAPSERHIVKLQVELGPDRRVTKVEAVGGKSSPSYRAALERAKRALRHPFCEQLDVPPGKLAQWKSLILNFGERKKNATHRAKNLTENRRQ